jgi:hypothetical protein
VLLRHHVNVLGVGTDVGFPVDDSLVQCISQQY